MRPRGIVQDFLGQETQNYPREAKKVIAPGVVAGLQTCKKLLMEL